MSRLCFVGVLLPSLLAACGGPVELAALGASAVSLAVTGKSPTDHAMSFATGRDCSILAQFDARPYCGEAERASLAGDGPPAMPRYCYRTLADIVCYEEPDRDVSAERRVQ